MNFQIKRLPGQLDRSRQAAPQIHETLRERILSLQLAPNTVLSRQSLQTEFGVSQTPVRDALMKLEQEHLVEIYPQHATVVARIDLGAARQAHFLRRAIESDAARKLARERPDDLLPRLKRILEDQRRLAAARDQKQFELVDREFHHCLYDAAGVPDLWEVVRRQSGQIDRLRLLHLPLPGKMDQIIRDHRLIAKAIESGDAEGAAEAVNKHLSGTLSIIPKIREHHPDYLLPE
jgi:DNA-binding GntR family transcriptional regulator